MKWIDDYTLEHLLDNDADKDDVRSHVGACGLYT